MNHTHLKQTAALLLAASLTLTAAGCGQQQAVPAAAQEESAGIAVSVQTPQQSTLETKTSFIGTVQPDEIVSIFAELPATVEEIYFQPGDQVKKGDLLFELDDKDVMTSVKTAQAAYRSAAAQVDQMTGSSYKNTLQQLDTAYDNAYENYKEADDAADDAEAAYKAAKEAYESALEGGLVPGGSSIDELFGAMQRAQASASAARAMADQMETLYQNARKSYNINAEQGYVELTEVAAATLNQAQVGLDAAMDQLENCKVRSPIDGVVESVSLSKLNMASTTSPAFVISNKNVLMVTFGVSSSAVFSMKPGDPVTVEKGQSTYNGTITEVSTMASAQNGLFTVKAVLETSDAQLLTGVSVKVTAATDKAENAMVLPQNAVYYDDGKPYVYILEEGAARQVYIETGVSNAEEVQVTSGLSLDDQVITSWHPNLTDGTPVVIAQ